jgi:16S rRNA processing protein RimM
LTAAERQVAAGRVGRPHGLDGSFHVTHPTADLAEGTEVEVAGRTTVVERRAGTADRPIIRIRGVSDRDAAGEIRGEPLLVPAGELEEGEFLIEDLVGCRVAGVGVVVRVVNGASCDFLEVGEDGVLIPLISDAVKHIDTGEGVIEVDRAFLGLDPNEP